MTNALLYQLFLSLWIVMMYALHYNRKPGTSSRWLWLAGPVVSGFPFLLPPGTIHIVQSFTLPDVAANVSQIGGESAVDWVFLIYGVGAGFAFFTIAYRVALVFSVRKQSTLIHDEGNAWLELPEDKAMYGAFSFFNWIFLPGNTEAELRDCMYLHEKVHANKLHSLDVFYVNVLKVVFWFNPMMLLMQAGLKDCHEYEADFETSSQVGAGRYANALVSSSFGLKAIMPIVHPFGSVRNIKSRINMLHSSKSPRFTWLWMVALSASFISFQACSNSTDSKTGSLEAQSSVADRNAEFPGGMDAMIAFVSENMNYPKEAEESGIEGKIYVKFLIAEDGTAGDATIGRSLSPELDAAALLIIDKMPKWTPAMKDGKAVSVEMVLPVAFALE